MVRDPGADVVLPDCGDIVTSAKYLRRTSPCEQRANTLSDKVF
jgi:hypothetical protein